MFNRVASQQRFDPDHLLLLVRINQSEFIACGAAALSPMSPISLKVDFIKKGLVVLKTMPFFSVKNNSTLS